MSGTTRETRRCVKCHAKAREAAQSSGGGDTSERMRQGLPFWKSTDLDGCKNPNCLAPEDKVFRAMGGGDARRCNACYKWKERKGSERPVEFCSKDDWRGLVKVYAGCKNPGCGKPEGVGELSDWRYSGDNRRCPTCRAYQLKKKCERPALLCSKDAWRRDV
jgi:hypothetical protein